MDLLRSQFSLPRQIMTLVMASAVGVWAEVERDELKAGLTFDIGQIQEGHDTQFDQQGQMIQRTAVFMNQKVSVGGRLDLFVGIGGLFWYSTPETELAYQRYVKFGPGVGQAQASLKLGDIE